MLDMSVRAKILELLLDLKRELGLTYVFITHDLATAKFVCDRIAILYLGKVVETGPAAAVYAAPQHPYTRALLDAVPSPDPGQRHQDRRLPSGDVPDAIDPPGGCRFHPRCPDAFAPCGWEGRDLVAALEERWTDPATFEAECRPGRPAGRRSMCPRDAVVFPRGGEALAELLGRLRDDAGPPRVLGGRRPSSATGRGSRCASTPDRSRRSSWSSTGSSPATSTGSPTHPEDGAHQLRLRPAPDGHRHVEAGRGGPGPGARSRRGPGAPRRRSCRTGRRAPSPRSACPGRAGRRRRSPW